MRGGGPNASTDEASGPRQVHVSGFSWPETEGRMNQLSRALPASGVCDILVTSSVPVDEDMTGDSPSKAIPQLRAGLSASSLQREYYRELTGEQPHGQSESP